MLLLHIPKPFFYFHSFWEKLNPLTLHFRLLRAISNEFNITFITCRLRLTCYRRSCCESNWKVLPRQVNEREVLNWVNCTVLHIYFCDSNFLLDLELLADLLSALEIMSIYFLFLLWGFICPSLGG